MYLMIIERELSAHMSRGTHSSVYGNNMPRWPIYMYGTQHNGKDWEKSTRCIIARGIMCKNTHSSNNACPYDKMNSTIVFIMKFCPKIMYDMTKMEQGCTQYTQYKNMTDLNEFESNQIKKKGGKPSGGLASAKEA